MATETRTKSEPPRKEPVQTQVRWKNKTLAFALAPSATVGDLRAAIEQETGCLASKTKLFFRRKDTADSDPLTQALEGQRGPIRMFGSPEADVQATVEKMKEKELVSDRNAKVFVQYTHGDGRKEKVRLVKKHDDADGGGWTIFIPSLDRERQTTAERLDFTSG